MKKYLLFDLDGTLTDPKLGITTCVQYALRSFGIEEPDLDKLEPFIGPPLRDSFMNYYGLSAEQAEDAVVKYRERFRDTGLFENEVYDGVSRMLRRLRAHGMVLAVASSKPQVFVERILEHFQLKKYFTVVVGSELNGAREKKEEVVQEALNRLFSDRPIDREQVYMIGDRKFDVEGAKALGVESVAVTYGYGDMQELKEARADYIVQSVDELERFLLRGADEEAGRGLGKKIVREGMTILYAVLLFELARRTVLGLFHWVLPEGLLSDGDRSVILSALGFAGAGLIVLPIARPLMRRRAEETKLEHLKRDPPETLLFLGIAAVGASVGLNILLELTAVSANSAAYRAVAAGQYSCSFLTGLIVFGLISPVAEELLFRGVIYNSMRRLGGFRISLLCSSLLFGLYHMNIVQGIYGFLMGCLIVYAYEYFGDFKMAVGVHLAVNILIYCLSYSGFAMAGLMYWPVCIVCLALAAVGLWLMRKRKKIF